MLQYSFCSLYRASMCCLFPRFFFLSKPQSWIDWEFSIGWLAWEEIWSRVKGWDGRGGEDFKDRIVKDEAVRRMAMRLGGWKWSVGLKLDAGAHLEWNEFGELRIWCGLERASGAGEVRNWGWEGKDKEGIWRTRGQEREGFLELWCLQRWRWKLPMCPEYPQPRSTLGSRTDACVLHCTVVLTGMAFRNTMGSQASHLLCVSYRPSQEIFLYFDALQSTWISSPLKLFCVLIQVYSRK